MEKLALIVKLAIGIAWPVTVLSLALLYKPVLLGVIKKMQEITVKLPNGLETTLKIEQAEKVLSDLFQEFYERYNALLNQNQRQFFRKVLNYSDHKDFPPTVEEVLPGFDRADKEMLGMLRALRGLGLIEPIEGGNWQANSRIQVTKFGKALTQYLKEQNLI